MIARKGALDVRTTPPAVDRLVVAAAAAAAIATPAVLAGMSFRALD
jgi:hypothetical protein